MITNIHKVLAFIVRDFLSSTSYRLAFVLQLTAMLMSLFVFYFFTKMVNPAAAGLDGVRPFDWLLIGTAFQAYFSIALYSFSDKIRGEQVLGTLEAMLVTPTPTGMVIFSSAAYDFTYGAVRTAFVLICAVFIFDAQLYFNNLAVLSLGVALTLLSSAGLGILSASFILYFKRGDPINFVLSGLTMFFGSVFFPVEQLPEWIRPVSSLVPMYYSLKVVRGALLHGSSFSDLQTELLSLGLLTLVLLPGGLLASRVAIRKAKRVGSLVQY